MNQPQGFTLNAAGKVVDTDPVKILFNPATGYEVPHMILAAYIVTGLWSPRSTRSGCSGAGGTATIASGC